MRRLEKRFWMKLIIPSCPSTQEATRCTMICVTCIGGQIWNRTSLNTSQNVTFVEGLRQITCVPLGFYSPFYPGLEMGRYFYGFYCGLPRTSKGYDSIWVIMDHLTKSAHFLPVDTRYSAKKYAKLYFDRIVTLHGVPLTIVSDRGSVFVPRFW